MTTIRKLFILLVVVEAVETVEKFDVTLCHDCLGSLHSKTETSIRFSNNSTYT